MICPRCRGNLFRDYDRDGWFTYCLQCGFLKYDKERNLVPLPLLPCDYWKDPGLPLTNAQMKKREAQHRWRERKKLGLVHA